MKKATITIFDVLMTVLILFLAADTVGAFGCGIKKSEALCKVAETTNSLAAAPLIIAILAFVFALLSRQGDKVVGGKSLKRALMSVSFAGFVIVANWVLYNS